LKNTQISNLIKIHPVEAKFLRADGYTDRHDETNNQFLQFSKCAYKPFQKVGGQIQPKT
jgi:hypothetical protein